jgi:hypothetical protein
MNKLSKKETNIKIRMSKELIETELEKIYLHHVEEGRESKKCLRNCSSITATPVMFIT